MALTKYQYLFTLLFTCVYSRTGPILDTPLGQVAGIFSKSYNGRTFSSFYGIPYAKPPIGELRFEEPQPVEPWPGIWNATADTLTCAQITHAPVPEGGIYEGNEDCLYLNVFVPRETPTDGRLLDVVVHIHGGAFMFGSMNQYAGPKYLMDVNVVLVTVNYRLGILGFLSTGDDVLPGNSGMKDQTTALRWVRDNIRHFGGNPESVTLTGLSAGGASVHFHYLSPLSKGLFHRGIAMSGNALCSWRLQLQPLQRAKLIASLVGCDHDDTRKLVNCLKERPVRQIVEVTRSLRPWLYNPYSPLSLTIEKPNDKAFLPDHPYVLLERGKTQDLPFLASLTSEEGLYPGAEFFNDKHLADLERRWYELAPHVLHYNFSVAPELRDEVSHRLKKSYLQDRPISKETFMDLINMLSDGLFTISGEKAVKMQSHASKSNVYFYYFCYRGENIESFSVHFAGYDQKFGVSHGDDMVYLFSNPRNPNVRLTKSDEDMKNVFLGMWTSFIESNAPIVPGVKWTPVAKNDDPLEHLRINSPKELFMERVDEVDRHRDVWEDVPLLEERLFSKFGRNEL